MIIEQLIGSIWNENIWVFMVDSDHLGLETMYIEIKPCNNHLGLETMYI